METLTAFAKIPAYLKKTFSKTGTFRWDYWFIFGAIYAFMVIVVSSFLHYIVSPFSPLSHWVSNLGIGPNGSDLVFNYGLMGTAILYFAMAIFMWRKFQGVSETADKMLVFSTILGISAVVGIFILTNNLMSSGSRLHIIGAYLFFVCTPFFTGMSTGVFALTNTGVSRSLKFVTLFHVLMSILMIPASFISSALLDVGSGGMLGSADPGFAVVRVIEWLAVLSFFAWIFQAGIHLLQNKNLWNLQHSTISNQNNLIILQKQNR